MNIKCKYFAEITSHSDNYRVMTCIECGTVYDAISLTTGPIYEFIDGDFQQVKSRYILKQRGDVNG